MNLCVCEDDPQQLLYLKQLLRRHTVDENIQIIGFDNPNDLLEFADEHHIDIVIMDVNLGEENGIEFVNLLHLKQFDAQVIFVTGYSEHRSLVYEAKHMYFLDKPINEQLLLRALQKAKDAVTLIRSQQPPQLVVSNKDTQMVIEFAEIIYIESFLRKLQIYTVKDGMVETYRAMRDVLHLLDERFLQCHKSYVVNMDFITRCVRRKVFQLAHHDTEIPISQARSAEAYRKFMNYIGRID